MERSATTFVATALLLVALSLPVLAQPEETSTAEQDQREFARLAAIFDPPGTPTIQDKPWVEVDVGPSNWPSKIHGWVVEKGQANLTVRDLTGKLHPLRLASPEETRPRVPEIDGGDGFRLSDISKADFFIAWSVQPQDYFAESEKFLAAGLPKEGDPEELLAIRNDREGLTSHILFSAQRAHVAQVLGRPEHARELLALARQGLKKCTSQFLFDPDVTLHAFVADRLANRLRHRVVCDAHDGLPRTDLLKQWERIARIPNHPHQQEADQMLVGYRQMIDEDAKWIEPDAKAIAQWPTDKQVDYWLYKLRDLDVGQSMNPGNCNILSGDVLAFWGRNKVVPNPAEELKKLGAEAVPMLIAHLNDTRPTRCKEHWRSYWPEGHHLLTYGDCCQQILDGITDGAMFGYKSRRARPLPKTSEQEYLAKFKKWQSEQSHPRQE
jgi:hypothetical protein